MASGGATYWPRAPWFNTSLAAGAATSRLIGSPDPSDSQPRAGLMWCTGGSEGFVIGTSMRPPWAATSLLLCLSLAQLGIRVVDGTCDVSCLDLTFSPTLPPPHEHNRGVPVCGHEGCGHAAPYVGLENFGCSAQADAWGSACCNERTCPGAGQVIRPSRSHPATAGPSPAPPPPPPAPPRPAGAPCGSAEGACHASDLQRRMDAVTAECCNQPSESCPHGMPLSCNAGCASVFLPFWNDCQSVVHGAADAYAELVSDCRAADRAAGVKASGRAPYKLDIEYSGANWLDGWDFFTDADPTQGCVRYVDAVEAAQRRLTAYEPASNTFQIRADASDLFFDCKTDGRPSVRLASKKTWHAGGLFVIDLTHMPTGCATWPAFWLVAAPCGRQAACSWPIGGEIDIIEGANLNTRVLSTLHTTGNCAMNPACSDYPNMTGSFPAERDCDGSANGNAGCGIQHPAHGTFGAPLNSQGGGVFAAEWMERSIKIWFFTHDNVPRDLHAGTPEPRGWGAPYAAWPLEANCASTHFEDLQIVFDTTFCGPFASSTYGQQCHDQPASCHTATAADSRAAGKSFARCWAAITAAKAKLQAPEFGGCLSATSTDAEIQAVLFANSAGGCVRPCGVDMSTTCTPGPGTALTCSDAAADLAANPQDSCNQNIDWVVSHGLFEHPDWYTGSGLSPTSDRRAIQAWLFHKGTGGCMLPCGDIASLNLPFNPGPGRPKLRTHVLTPPTDAAKRCEEKTLWEPAAFQKAFWDVKSVKVFQPTGLVQTCRDGVQGEGEQGVDCGGPCPPCKAGSQRGACGTPIPGDACYTNVRWALAQGLPKHPEWYAGSCLGAHSDPVAVQAWFYARMPEQACPRPCGDLSHLHLCFQPTIGGKNCGTCPHDGASGH